MSKQTSLSASILELSKLFMLEFHYDVMKKKQTDCQRLYSNTDTFIDNVKTKNFFNNLEKNLELQNHFDLSNFPTDHQLYDRSKQNLF